LIYSSLGGVRLSKYAVVAENISKSYKLYKNPKDKLKDLILPKDYGKDFYALKNVSFKVEKGEVVGLLGMNGSGKSTLSNILGGISVPSSGEIEINGETSIIAISSGLNNQLTGLENIELKGLMLGMTRDKIREITQDIIDFADIGEFICQPVKTYSSGMKARLGFAISVNIDPDILVIDEALSVGDPTFTEKCLVKMKEFKESGKTIFFVSHAMPQVREFCSKAMWIEYGVLKAYGEVNETVDKYQEFLNRYNRMSPEEKKLYRKEAVENHHHLLIGEAATDFVGKEYNIKSLGKVFKHVILTNDKKVKVIPYNFDFHTFAFSIITSLLRKDVEATLAIIGIILCSAFVFASPFVGYLVLMVLFSFVSGRMYVNKLIKKRGYIPYNNYEEKLTRIQFIKQTNIRKNKYLNLVSVLFIVTVCSLYFVSSYGGLNIRSLLYRNSLLSDNGGKGTEKGSEGKQTGSSVGDKYLSLLVARVNENNLSSYWRTPILQSNYLNNALVNSLYLIKINYDDFEISIQQIPSKLQVNYPNKGYTDELMYAYAEGGKEYLQKVVVHNFNFKPDKYLLLSDSDINTLYNLLNIEGNVSGNSISFKVHDRDYRTNNLEIAQLIDQEVLNKTMYDMLMLYLRSEGDAYSKVKNHIMTLNGNLDATELEELYRTYHKLTSVTEGSVGSLKAISVSTHSIKMNQILDLTSKSVANKENLLNYEIYLKDGNYKNNVFYKMFN
jgi:ABC-type polysaccharide/polyol phosphate transport system ATPase subunit